MFPKIARYFESPTSAADNESGARLKKVVNPEDSTDFEYKYVSEDSEGIAFTVWNMYKQLLEHKQDVIKKGSLTDTQKKNVSYLLGDIVTATFLSLGIAGVYAGIYDDDEEKGAFAQLLRQRYDMATGDVFFPKSLIDMTTGNSSMFIGVSIAARAAKAALETAYVYPQALFDSEVGTQEFIAAHDKLFGASFGLYKSGQFAYEFLQQGAEDNL